LTNKQFEQDGFFNDDPSRLVYWNQTLCTISSK